MYWRSLSAVMQIESEIIVDAKRLSLSANIIFRQIGIYPGA